jgi:hypothetical protein
MNVMMCGRRTINDGEVVTFAAGFAKNDHVFPGFDAIGQFEPLLAQGLALAEICRRVIDFAVPAKGDDDVHAD